MLIELMVGLVVAALAISAAIASLLVARDATSAVNDMSRMQQQAAHAMRVLGSQIRPAGSLDLQAGGAGTTLFQFAPEAPALEGGAVVHGTEGASDTLRLVQSSPPLLPSQRRDCLGQEIAPGKRIDALFQVDGKRNLRCKSSSGQVQPLVAGVAAFKLRYRVRQGDKVRSLGATEVEQAQLWSAVTALEVCLDLHGEERAAAYEGSYIGCAGQSAVRDGRLHLLTRGLLRLRTREGS